VPKEVKDLVDQFDARLHARNPTSRLSSVDPYLVEGLLGGGLLCLKALRHDDSEVERRDLRLGLEQVRQALRDIVDEAPVADDRDAKQLVRWLVGPSDSRRATCVTCVAPRTLQRWSPSTRQLRQRRQSAAVVART
jgi:hypothetical protein